jgi:hypothetical protein
VVLNAVTHDVFISYAHHDKATADAVCSRVEAANIRCWIAPRDIIPGKPWDDAVVDAISATKILVVIFSASANASRRVLDEVATAVDTGLTVIPFRIAEIRPTGALRLHLGRVHWLDAMATPLEPHVDRLIESIRNRLSMTTQPEIETNDSHEEGQQQASTTMTPSQDTRERHWHPVPVDQGVSDRSAVAEEDTRSEQLPAHAVHSVHVEPEPQRPFQRS